MNTNTVNKNINSYEHNVVTPAKDEYYTAKNINSYEHNVVTPEKDEYYHCKILILMNIMLGHHKG